MTNIEQEFFKTFGLEPIMLCDCEFKNLYDYRIEYGQDVCIHIESKAKNPCLKCKLAKQVHPLYPEITDRVLLELICILSRKDNNYIVLDKQNNIEELKQYILTQLINNEYRVDIDEIQSLFREREE